MTAVVLSGCNPNLNVAQICEAQPQMCTDVAQESWCRRTRSEFIHSRYINHRDGGADNMYQLLTHAEDYNRCMSNVVHMVDKPGTQGDTNRGHWYTLSIQSLETLKQQSRDSSDPLLALYHWTRDKNPQAQQRFLQAEQAGLVTSRKAMQLAAIYFAKQQPNKSHHYVKRLLTGVELSSRYDQELFELAANSYKQQGQQAQALVFALLSNSQQISAEALAKHYRVAIDQLQQIEQESDKVKRLLNDGEFDPEQWKM
ncbi:DUF2989 domain-containing protein [uncultured Ferrimonas sp.]|uniref:DUF2989 domain-containing protein n=1 Tax=uncultured Ferrimonas sp. TaxID=432640 RepID=UPI002610D4F4|nr:DUF2989 domain-containing protein [uncultured Ferrimonas sp.]